MSIKKALWFTAGVLLLGLAYIGLIVPGIPWSTPTVGAAYCFAKSSDRMHNWLYTHPVFGPFLTNWKEKRIFPQRLKYFMLVSMSASLALLWFGTYNLAAVAGTGTLMIVVAIWGFRYPSSEAEWQRRKDSGERVAWLK